MKINQLHTHTEVVFAQKSVFPDRNYPNMSRPLYFAAPELSAETVDVIMSGFENNVQPAEYVAPSAPVL